MSGAIDWDPSLFCYNFGDPDSVNDDDSPPHMMHGVVINPFFDWTRRPLAADPVRRQRHLRGARQGPDRAAPGHPGEPARHLRRRRPSGGDRPPHQARRHRDRADAGAPVRAGQHAARQGPVELLGLQHDRVLRPAQRTTPRPATAASRCRSSRAWCRTLHEAGIEVILDVVYNHTAEGNHLGPDAVLPGHRQPAPTTGWSTTTSRVLHGLHRHRQLAQRAAPAFAAADHGLAALLGDRDARRRLPLRPGRHAGPGVLRRRPAVDVLRTRPAGPGRLPGEADRRAVGHRPRRLPGRQLPAAVDRVERQVPRHRPRLLARRAGDARRVRRPGSPDRPTCTSTTAAGRSRRSTSSPRTTASRSPTWSRTTRSTTRPTARTTTTANRTTGRGTAASRVRPTTPTIHALRAPPAAQLPGDAAALAGRADDRCTATSSAAPSTATTTPTPRTPS